MRHFGASDLMHTLAEKRYRVFSGGKFDLNIVGVRSVNSKSNSFDDVLCVLYKDNFGQWVLEKFECTTDPGKHWLLNPLNKNGTLIMVPSQTRGAYKIGVHGRTGRYPYEALEQVKPMPYVRDNNKDTILNFDLIENKANWIRGVFKTNIHRASKWKTLLGIGKYSAGCQVIQSPQSFDRFMALCILQVKSGHGNSFTYTLINENDI
tara:strand:- start:382 stop:1002 length:621 start_codon:yes stop_codon:yes gene_type:complete